VNSRSCSLSLHINTPWQETKTDSVLFDLVLLCSHRMFDLLRHVHEISGHSQMLIFNNDPYFCKFTSEGQTPACTANSVIDLTSEYTPCHLHHLSPSFPVCVCQLLIHRPFSKLPGLSGCVCVTRRSGQLGWAEEIRGQRPGLSNHKSLSRTRSFITKHIYAPSQAPSQAHHLISPFSVLPYSPCSLWLYLSYCSKSQISTRSFTIEHIYTRALLLLWPFSFPLLPCSPWLSLSLSLSPPLLPHLSLCFITSLPVSLSPLLSTLTNATSDSSSYHVRTPWNSLALKLEKHVQVASFERLSMR